MKLRRDEFIGQFAIPFSVHCLRLWNVRRKEPPTVITPCLYEWIKTANGTVNLKPHEFGEIARPMVEELYRAKKGEKPTMDELAGALYDALAAAGAEVTVGKPAAPSSMG